MTDRMGGGGLAPSADAAELYLDILKRTLTRTIDDSDLQELIHVDRLTNVAMRMIRKLPHMRHVRLVRPMHPEARAAGRDWPTQAETMVGVKRLDNLQMCVTEVLRQSVPGDLIETGVWRGGASIFMRGILKAYGETSRTVWVADSFAGLPPPDTAAHPEDAGMHFWKFDYLAVPLLEVQANFARYRLLDDQVRFLPGWFKDTLPAAPIERLAVMRLDGDMYESTIDALGALYPKLSPGGYAIIDDYGPLPACKSAVDDYRRQHAITEPIQDIDGMGVYWQKRPMPSPVATP
jgi:O-methyltransferase